MSDIKYEITKHIGVLSESAKGWTKELNLVIWNGREPKYDIREWSLEHEKMGKGVTLSGEEIAVLKKLLDGSLINMSNDIKFIKWFNVWDKDYSNIELGFSDHSTLKGLVEINENMSLDDFDDKDFFEQLKSEFPLKFKDIAPDRSEIACCINGKTYFIIYYYKNSELQIIDESKTILKFN